MIIPIELFSIAAQRFLTLDYGASMSAPPLVARTTIANSWETFWMNTEGTVGPLSAVTLKAANGRYLTRASSSPPVAASSQDADWWGMTVLTPAPNSFHGSVVALTFGPVGGPWLTVDGGGRIGFSNAASAPAAARFEVYVPPVLRPSEPFTWSTDLLPSIALDVGGSGELAVRLLPYLPAPRGEVAVGLSTGPGVFPLSSPAVPVPLATPAQSVVTASGPSVSIAVGPVPTRAPSRFYFGVSVTENAAGDSNGPHFVQQCVVTRRPHPLITIGDNAHDHQFSSGQPRPVYRTHDLTVTVDASVRDFIRRDSRLRLAYQCQGRSGVIELPSGSLSARLPGLSIAEDDQSTSLPVFRYVDVWIDVHEIDRRGTDLGIVAPSRRTAATSIVNPPRRSGAALRGRRTLASSGRELTAAALPPEFSSVHILG